MIVAGVDMALANVGLVLFDVRFGGSDIVLTPLEFKLLSTQPQAGKQVRKSSDTLRRAAYLVKELGVWCSRAELTCAEVPTGSQSASASNALGVAVGVLASCPTVIAEVSPHEVKMATVGKRNAKKNEMCDWAYRQWPDAPWLTHNGKRTGNNEHLADACAAIVAAYKHNNIFTIFLQASHATARNRGGGSPPHQQPARQLPLEAVPRARHRVRTLPR